MRPLTDWSMVDWSYSDREIATDLGCTVTTVRRRRPGGTNLSPKRLAPFAHLIGVESDVHVATMAGVSRQAVQWWRRNRGIPSPMPQGASRVTLKRAFKMLTAIVLRGGAPTEHERAVLAHFCAAHDAGGT